MNIVRLGSIDSTNAEARRRLEAETIDAPVLIIASEQTAGRGTRGRRWESPAGAGLYLSFVDPKPTRDAPSETITLAAGVACAEAIEHFGIAVRLKPINDLIAGGGKLGGILTETTVRGGRLQTLVIGIGINIHPAPRDLPEGALPATSLADLVPPQQLAAIEAGLPERIGDRLLYWLDQPAEVTTQQWNRRALAET